MKTIQLSELYCALTLFVFEVTITAERHERRDISVRVANSKTQEWISFLKVNPVTRSHIMFFDVW